jgi:hypothetical protein
MADFRDQSVEGTSKVADIKMCPNCLDLSRQPVIMFGQTLRDQSG